MGFLSSVLPCANEAPQIPDNMGDSFRGIYPFTTDGSDFQRNFILTLGLFAVGVWLARNLGDIYLMAPHPGCSQTDT
uniref:Uncharacterized protein n=1 Tax=Neovison vison TaxID=452646 RepID=A0A8C7A2F7_NEOVI